MQTTVELARVTRVTKGGKRMRFRACVVVGDKKGSVGFGVAKGADVTLALSKAARQAKKNMVKIILEKGTTIPHVVYAKYKAAKVLLKPAPPGSGIIAGGSVRMVLEAAGVPDVVSKCLGSKSKINNIKATFEAIKKLRARRK
ncbi:MAG: 30S ribosomal protein S5 [Patescibacteria group bacterium]